ncbi:MAG: hypothetical protein IK057_05990 [Clostridia bacterium]|nr:hypothetical protein [Clostridia bacterium]
MLCTNCEKRHIRKGSKAKLVIILLIAAIIALSATVIYLLKDKKSGLTDEPLIEQSEIEAVEEKIDSVNMITAMSEGERKAINVFFSNFSEAHFAEYSNGSQDNFSLISFAFTHNLINNNKKTIWQDEKMGISVTTVNQTLDRFFGVKVPPETADTGHGYGWTYEDGSFWMPAASGESYDYYSIVNDMHDVGNGLFEVSYDAFYAGYDELSDECYSYTIDEARKNSEYIYSATAIVKPKTYNGKKTYEIVELTANQEAF